MSAFVRQSIQWLPTHVRHLLGYDRFDRRELVEMMNDLYQHDPLSSPELWRSFRRNQKQIAGRAPRIESICTQAGDRNKTKKYSQTGNCHHKTGKRI